MQHTKSHSHRNSSPRDLLPTANVNLATIISIQKGKLVSKSHSAALSQDEKYHARAKGGGGYWVMKRGFRFWVRKLIFKYISFVYEWWFYLWDDLGARRFSREDRIRYKRFLNGFWFGIFENDGHVRSLTEHIIAYGRWVLRGKRGEEGRGGRKNLIFSEKGVLHISH